MPLLGFANVLSVSYKIKYLCALEIHIWVLQSGEGSYRMAGSFIIWFLIEPSAPSTVSGIEASQQRKVEWVENGRGERFCVMMSAFSDEFHNVSFSMRCYCHILVTGTDDQQWYKSKWSYSRKSAVPRILGDLGRVTASLFYSISLDVHEVDFMV